MNKCCLDTLTQFISKYKISGCSVLDVGGQDVCGSPRSLFANCKYTSLDLENADIVVKGYDWSCVTETYDVVISIVTFEHDKYFWLTLANIARVTKPGGIICIIAPSKGPIHRHPVDCYRFYPDAYHAFAPLLKATLLDLTELPDYPEQKCQWGKLMAVYRKL